MKEMLLAVLVFAGVSSGGVLFQDDFNDGNDDGWVYTFEASYRVIDGACCISSSGGGGNGESVNGDIEGIMSTPDYSVLCTVEVDIGISAGIVARYNGADQWHYRLLINPVADRVQLYAKKDTGLRVILDQCNYPLEFDTPCNLRLEVEGDSIRARVWYLNSSGEPSDWLLSAVDTRQQNSGSVGLYASGYGTGKVNWASFFDDFVVSTPVEQQLNQITWGLIKQAGVGN